MKQLDMVAHVMERATRYLAKHEIVAEVRRLFDRQMSDHAAGSRLSDLKAQGWTKWSRRRPGCPYDEYFMRPPEPAGQMKLGL